MNRVLLAGVAALACAGGAASTASAQAPSAPAVAVAFGSPELVVGDPVELRTAVLGAADGDVVEVSLDPGGSGATCPPPEPSSGTVISRREVGGPSPDAGVDSYVPSSTGTFLACARLRAGGPGGAVRATGSTPVRVRLPHVELALRAPATVAGGTTRIVTFAVASDVRTLLTFAVARPGRRCTREPPVGGESAYVLQRRLAAPVAAGRHRLRVRLAFPAGGLVHVCGWVSPLATSYFALARTSRTVRVRIPS